MSIKNLNNEELVKQYQIARQMFVFAEENSFQEKTAEQLYDELFKELCKRNIDLRNFKN